MLERALAALDGGNDAAALEALAEAWRKSRSRRLAELAGLVAKRSPSPLAQSLSTLIAPRVAATLARWEALGEVDDPLASTWVLEALANPPFTGASARPLLEVLIDAAERMRDPRLIERAPAMMAVWDVRVTPKAARVALQARLAKAVGAVGREGTIVLDRKSAHLADALAARFAGELKGARTVEELYADVYAHPDDDGPRHVLADALLERGDPRGEFIALQLKPTLDDADRAREAALVKAHGQEWLGPLAPVVSWGKESARARFERGFLVSAIGKKLRLVFDEPSWATVEELRGNFDPELLARAPLRSLKRIERALVARELAAVDRPLALEEVGLWGSVDTAVVARVLPRLRVLHVTSLNNDDLTPMVAEALARLPVRRLTLTPSFSTEAGLDALVVTCRKLVQTRGLAIEEIDVLSFAAEEPLFALRRAR